MSRFASLALDTETPRKMLIRHPATGEQLKNEAGDPAFIELLALSSRPAQRVRAAIQQRRIDNRVRRVTLEEAEQEMVEVLAACTTGWLLVGLDGAEIPVPASPDAAAELYATPGMRYLFDQALAFAEQPGNFLPTSSTN